MALANTPNWSVTEYLALDRESEIKHEYIGDQPWAMSGASREHNLIVAALVATLIEQLRGKPCEVYPSDMRVTTPAQTSYTYPDVTVVCEEPVFTDDPVDTLTNPTVVVEVLSDSTERVDRGAKFHHYQTIPTLQEYLLVSQSEPRIERYVRQESSLWQYAKAHGRESLIEVPSIEITLQLSVIYERITDT